MELPENAIEHFFNLVVLGKIEAIDAFITKTNFDVNKQDHFRVTLPGRTSSVRIRNRLCFSFHLAGYISNHSLGFIH